MVCVGCENRKKRHVFHTIAKKQKLSLGAYNQPFKYCRTKAVSERDALKSGIGIWVERGGTREARTVRRAGHTYDYDPNDPIGNITIHLREKFWLEARHLIGNDGKAYIPVHDLRFADDENYTDKESDLQVHAIADDEDDPTLVLAKKVEASRRAMPSKKPLKAARRSVPIKKPQTAARRSAPRKKVKGKDVRRQLATGLKPAPASERNKGGKPGSASKRPPKRRTRKIIPSDTDDDEALQALAEADRLLTLDEDYSHHPHDTFEPADVPDPV